MGVDGRRDHSFRIPQPDLFAETGALDTCTACHENRSPDRAAARIADWYPNSVNRQPHNGQVFARAQQGLAAQTVPLAALAQDGDQAGIGRATALWLLQQSPDVQTANTLAPLLASPDPLVRAAAIGAQGSASPQDIVMRFVPLLGAPVKNVRIAAARQLLGAPVARLPERSQPGCGPR